MKFERVIYVTVAVVAFVWTQWLVIELLRGGASLSSTWDAMTANATTQFIAVDLFAVFIVGVTFMIIEGRRLRLKLWWIYPLISVAIAISVGLPLFLLARSLRKEA